MNDGLVLPPLLQMDQWPLQGLHELRGAEALMPTVTIGLAEIIALIRGEAISIDAGPGPVDVRLDMEEWDGLAAAVAGRDDDAMEAMMASMELLDGGWSGVRE